MSTNTPKEPLDLMARRRFLKTAGTASLAAMTASLALVAPAHAKVPQKAVMYQTTPKGGLKCAGCKFFQASAGECEKVAGKISPEGWCGLWVKK